MVPLLRKVQFITIEPQAIVYKEIPSQKRRAGGEKRGEVIELPDAQRNNSSGTAKEGAK